MNKIKNTLGAILMTLYIGCSPLSIQASEQSDVKNKLTKNILGVGLALVGNHISSLTNSKHDDLTQTTKPINREDTLRQEEDISGMLNQNKLQDWHELDLEEGSNDIQKSKDVQNSTNQMSIDSEELQNNIIQLMNILDISKEEATRMARKSKKKQPLDNNSNHFTNFNNRKIHSNYNTINSQVSRDSTMDNMINLMREMERNRKNDVLFIKKTLIKQTNDVKTLNQKVLDLENQKSTLENQKSILENQKSILENQKSTLENQKSTLENQKSTLENQKSTLENKISRFNNGRSWSRSLHGPL